MSHKVFDHVILFFILLNCVSIAMERPSINPKSMVRPTSGAVTDIPVIYSLREAQIYRHISDVASVWSYMLPSWVMNTSSLCAVL